MRAPLRPFPLPLNIGTDICQISRIYAIVSGPRRRRFIDRILAPEERAGRALGSSSTEQEDLKLSEGKEGRNDYHGVIARRDPELWKTAVFVAGRFAAKEAAIKAHPHRRLTFHDVIIERRAASESEPSRLGSGPPIARIKGLVNNLNDSTSVGGEVADASALISISHDGDYATATCMAYDSGSGEKNDDRRRGG